MNPSLNNCVVLLNQGPGGGTLPDFLDQLSPEIRSKYIFNPFYATTSGETETWVDELKLKLQQLCKKNCKKPIVVSALFNTEYEMLISRIQQHAKEWYLTSSTEEVKRSWANQRTLPLSNSNYPRNNTIYDCVGHCGYYNVYAPEITRNVNYIASLLSNVAKSRESLERIDGLAEIDSETIIADLTGSTPGEIWNLTVRRDELESSSSLSDLAFQQAALLFDNRIVIKQIEGSNYVVLGEGDERRYLKLFGSQNMTAPENLDVIF